MITGFAEGPLVGADSTLALGARGHASAGIQIFGSWTGVITFEGSINGTDWAALNVTRLNGTSPITTTTTNGVFVASTAGLTWVRVRLSTATTGAPTAAILGVEVGGGSSGAGGGGGGGGTSSSFGSPLPDAGTAAGFLKSSDGTMSAAAVDDSHNLKVAVQSGAGGVSPATSVHTDVAGSASSQTALSLNASALGRTFANDSDTPCYLKKGVTASATSFFIKLLPGQFYEMPKPVYVGRVDVIWDTGVTGSLRVNEDSA